MVLKHNPPLFKQAPKLQSDGESYSLPLKKVVHLVCFLVCLFEWVSEPSINSRVESDKRKILNLTYCKSVAEKNDADEFIWKWLDEMSYIGAEWRQEKGCR